MGTNGTTQKDIHSDINAIPYLNAVHTNVSGKFRSNLKKVVYVTSLAAIGFFFNGCMAGYVASEPEYVQYDRPARPNNVAIWIDGDWNWHNQSQQYKYQNGHWDNPRRGQTYKAGYWQTGSKGKIWTKGHWHSNGRGRTQRQF